MNEDYLAGRIRRALEQGLQEIPQAATRRLEAARHVALSRQKQSEPKLQLSTGTGAYFTNPSNSVPFFRQLLAVVVLLLGLWLTFYWHSVEYVGELEEVESALLTDDLPPEVFLDQEFLEWLENDSYQG